METSIAAHNRSALAAKAVAPDLFLSCTNIIFRSVEQSFEIAETSIIHAHKYIFNITRSYK